MNDRSLGWWWCGVALCAACGDGDSSSEGSGATGTTTLSSTLPQQTTTTVTASDSDVEPTDAGSISATDSGSTTAPTSTPSPTTTTVDPATTTTSTSATDTSDETTAGALCGGECTEQGGVCVGDTCCPTEDQACGAVCCPDGDFCSFNTCVTPGNLCIDASECDDDEYCEYSLGEPETMGGMCQGGIIPATGKCLPAPPTCMDGEDPGDPPTCLAKCEYVPEPGAFAPEVKYHWDKGTVMMAPIVVQLDDDNCDMIVDERDIPEIAFTTFVGGVYQSNGTIRVISIVDGAIVEKWTYNGGMTEQIAPGRELAGGDIDGVPGNEVVACTTTAKIQAFNGDGTPLWLSPPVGSCALVSIADLDQDGNPEVLTPGAILDGKTGAIETMLPGNLLNTAADLDNDGQLDVVHARGAFNVAGGVLAKTGLEGAYPAVGDLDLDGGLEVAVIANGGALLPHHLVVWRHSPGDPNGVEIIRAGIDINGALSPALCPMGSAGNTRGGGPPTIADFNGDGSAEVVYSDEIRLRVYKGTDGTVLWDTCNTTGTLVEYPLVADVDSDGHADIVAVSNNYSSINCGGTKQTGVRIFGDSKGQWVRTRRVWNQHSYHVTNTEESGAIPVVEQTNWKVPGLNNFRQNVQPEGEFAAPDLIVDLRLQCAPEDYGLVGRVRNIGEASVPSGVPVSFYEGDPNNGGTLLGTGNTTKVLYPAEAEEVVLLLPDPSPGVLDGSSVVWVVVDDPMVEHAWHECRVDNNTASGTGKCAMPG